MFFGEGALAVTHPAQNLQGGIGDPVGRFGCKNFYRSGKFDVHFVVCVGIVGHPPGKGPRRFQPDKHIGDLGLNHLVLNDRLPENLALFGPGQRLLVGRAGASDRNGCNG